MHRLLILAALLVSPALAQGAPADPGPSHTVADPIPAKPPLKLTDAQKKRIAQAINGKDTLDKLPDGFTPHDRREGAGAEEARRASAAAVADLRNPGAEAYESAQLAD